MPAAADVKYIHIGASRYIDHMDPKWCEWIQNEMHEFRSIRQALGHPSPSEPPPDYIRFPRNSR